VEARRNSCTAGGGNCGGAGDELIGEVGFDGSASAADGGPAAGSAGAVMIGMDPVGTAGRPGHGRCRAPPDPLTGPG
jgi:hypothetical protein